MNNSEREKLERLISAKDVEGQVREEKIERVRRGLENSAREVVDRYERWCERLKPEALDSIERVMQPWFRGLTEGGQFNWLVEWSDKYDEGGRDINLGGGLYFWPRESISELKSVQPFKDSAKYGYKNYLKDEGIKVQKEIVRGDVWDAGLILGKKRIGRKGLTIVRWPGTGGSFAFAVVSATGLEIDLDPLNIEGSFEKVSPEVWLIFSREIESGYAGRSITEAISSKKRRLETISSEVYYKERAKEVSKYKYIDEAVLKGI